MTKNTIKTSITVLVAVVICFLSFTSFSGADAAKLEALLSAFRFETEFSNDRELS